jgi:RND family efflux transporter MFP subunit
MIRTVAQLAACAALLGLPTLAPAQTGGPTSATSPTSLGENTVVREFGGYRAFTRPSRDATMGFSQPTQVQEILVKGGQSVKAGELLMRGDDREDQALLKLQRMRAETDLPIKGAKAAMDLAELEYQRLQEARQQGGSSPQELDRARLTLDRATVEYQQAILNQRQEVVQIERLDARIVHLRLQAPFDGQIDTIQVDVGQSVSENDKVIRIVNVDLLWIDVPASMMDEATQLVKDGDKAWVLVEAGGKFRMMEGKVIEVSPVADFSSRTRRVRVEFANPAGASRLVAGDPAWVRFTAPPEGVAKKVAAHEGGGRGK